MEHHPHPGRPPRRGRHGRRHHPRERTLSREAIVEAALAIVDREGVDAVTMRRVGEELGTGAASLYAHVEDKDELLGLVFDRAFRDVDYAVVPDPTRWQEQAKDLIRRSRAALLAHSDLAKVGLGRVPTGETALRATEAMCAVLKAGDLPDQVVGYAGDLLGLYITATSYETSLFMQAGALDVEAAEWREELRAYFASLPPEQFPTIVALAGALVGPDDEGIEERFEFGLDILIRGLAAHATH